MDWHLYEKDFFWDLPEEKRAFMSLAISKAFNKNDFVFLEDDPGGQVFYLEKGAVKICRITSAGKEPIVFIRKAGEMFGLAEVVNGEMRKCSAHALTSCVIYEVKKDDFESLLSLSHPLARKVISVLGRRVRYLAEQIENLVAYDVTTRILRLLFYLSSECLLETDSCTGPVRVPVRLTQEQLAACTGSCQQTVSETLHELQAEGIILLAKKEIMLLRPLEIMNRLRDQ
jgi:CRP/FNR family transcriptional regulator, cyclic AMP receptor protein